MQPEISIIMPTFNRADKLPLSIGSVQAQSFPDWELIVVDDGSTDQTFEMVSRLQQDQPENLISCIRQTNAGPSSARNRGVEQAHGNIIVYLDSDDALYPSALADIFWTLKDPKSLYGVPNHNRTLRLVDAKGSVLAQKFDVSGMNRHVTLEQIYNWEIKTTSSGLFHRRSLFESGIRWRSGFWIEDLEILLQMAVLAPDGFVHIPKVLVDYVQVYGADGLCSNSSYADWANAFEKIYELHKDDPLMTQPEVYLDRVKKYRLLHHDANEGKILPPQYKYFPEFNKPRA